jgi:inorganic pyrophosphatase
MYAINNLSPIDSQTGLLNVIVETPHGDRNKFKWDEKLGVFKVDRVLPDGAVFPFDFGFLPRTLADDGDPLDVITILDVPAAVGVLVPSRAIGLIAAEQTEAGETSRNDRLVAVAASSRTYQDVKSLDNISPALLYEFEQFFVNYHRLLGNEFKILGHHGVEFTGQMIQRGIELFEKSIHGVAAASIENHKPKRSTARRKTSPHPESRKTTGRPS